MENKSVHRVSKSFQWTPFSPSRSELEHSSKTRCGRRNWASILIPHKGAGFESQEPTSPEVSCIGQIKLKQKRVKESNKQKIPYKEMKKNMSKLKRFVLGSQNDNNNNSRAEVQDEGIKCREAAVGHPHPSLGLLKRYVSGSYDAKFGDLFVQKEAELSSKNDNDDNTREEAKDEEIKRAQAAVGNRSLAQIKRYISGSYDAEFGDMFVEKDVEMSSETVPPLSGRKEEESSTSIWKRRSISSPKDLDVCRIPVERFQIRKPFTM